MEDKPPTVKTPPAASPTGELTINLGANVDLFGTSDVGNTSTGRLRRILQDGSTSAGDFEIDIR